MLRLFAAIPVPPEIGALLQASQTGLPGARWRPIEALHITLRFFGAVAEPMADDLDTALERAGKGPFDIEIAGAGAFGEGDRVRAIWAGVEETPALWRLARACEHIARGAGLAPQTRNYAPHVTLAYLRHADPRDVAHWIADHNLLRAPVFRAATFGLYSSWPGEGGSQYRLERTYRLA